MSASFSKAARRGRARSTRRRKAAMKHSHLLVHARSRCQRPSRMTTSATHGLPLSSPDSRSLVFNCLVRANRRCRGDRPDAEHHAAVAAAWGVGQMARSSSELSLGRSAGRLVTRTRGLGLSLALCDQLLELTRSTGAASTGPGLSNRSARRALSSVTTHLLGLCYSRLPRSPGPR